MKHLVEDVGCFGCQTFLNLGPLGQDIHKTDYVAETGDPVLTRYIGQMNLAEEWQEVMFTQGVEGHILYEYHLVLVGCGIGFKYLAWIASQPGEDLRQHPRYRLRGMLQPGPGWILTCRFKELPDSCLNPFWVHFPPLPISNSTPFYRTFEGP